MHAYAHAHARVHTHRATYVVTLQLHFILLQNVYISIRGITIINRFRMVVWSMLFSEDEYSVEVQSGDPANTKVIDLDIVNATDSL